MPRLPSQEDYFRNSISPVTSLPGGFSQPEQCSICRKDCLPSPDSAVVNLKPCNHVFHRVCVLKWFAGPKYTRPDCPNCRRELFLPERMTSQQLAILTGESGSPPAVLARSTSHSHHPQRFSLTLQKLRNNHNQYNAQLAQDLQMLQGFVVAAIDHEQDHADDHADDRTHRGWIKVIDEILKNYRHAQYPLTDYVTQDSLIRLTIAAAFVHELSQMDRYKNSAAFRRLVSHSNTLLCQAQNDAKATKEPSVEHHRVLNYKDNLSPGAGNKHFLEGNVERVKWMVGLRVRCRGQQENPFGPTFGRHLYRSTLEPPLERRM